MSNHLSKFGAVGSVLVGTFVGLGLGIYIGRSFLVDEPLPIIEVEAPEEEQMRGMAAALPVGYEIKVGRVVPGTEDTDSPQRSEWKTKGEWAVFPLAPDLEVRVTPRDGKLYFVTSSTTGNVPARILFNGASNQVWLEFSKD